MNDEEYEFNCYDEPDENENENYNNNNSLNKDINIQSDRTNKDKDLTLKQQTDNILGYKIGRKEEAEFLMNNVIKEIEDFTQLDRDEAILVLLNIKWNKDKIKDSWYNNPESFKVKYGIKLKESIQSNITKNNNGNNSSNKSFPKFNLTSTTTKLKPIQPIQTLTLCVICDQEYKTSEFFGLKCNHIFCKECWVSYLEYRLEDIFTCILTPCMKSGCTLSVTQSVFNKMLNPTQIEKYRFALIKNFTEGNADIKWCPSPNCGRFVKSSEHNEREITCECKTVFCFKCLKEGHRPCPCKLVEIWEIKNSSESENVKWLLANTKKCPSCGKHIQKNQGCNHIICRKESGGCGYDFCWICLSEWGPHGSNWYNCNKYDPNEEKNLKKEESIKKIKNELEKYIFYFDRYLNHSNSIRISIRHKETIADSINLLNKNKKISFEDLQFLDSALDIVIRCQRTLKNTYIFGCYLQEESNKERNLFEYQQKLLEDNVQKLLELLEDNSINYLIDCENEKEFIKEFTSFKGNMINLYKATEKFQYNLAEEIENKMIGLIDYKQLKF